MQDLTLSHKNNFLGQRKQTNENFSSWGKPSLKFQTFLLVHLLKPTDGNIFSLCFGYFFPTIFSLLP